MTNPGSSNGRTPRSGRGDGGSSPSPGVQLIICRGLPACGKTTRAQAWVEEAPQDRARVNRDDIRRMLGTRHSHVTESAVRATRDAAISNLLRREISVVCDDTNLRQSVAREVAQIGRKHKAEIEVWDMTDVSLQTCLDRDTARREGGVGEDVIRGMHERYLKGRPWPLPLPEEPIDERAENQPYVPNTSLPSAVLVDVDGTVALRRGSRSPFDWARVGEDVPNPPVVSLVHSLARSHAIVFLSGRDGSCKQETYDWLYQHVIAPCTHLRVNGPLRLFMRAAGDTRKDAIVKRELFFEHVASKWNVVAVLDDRDQVVQMWRSLGLTCLQVADGAF